MISWSNYYYENERYKNMRREADEYRLVHQASHSDAKGPSLYSRVHSWLECRLTTLAYRLTTRQGKLVDAVPTC